MWTMQEEHRKNNRMNEAELLYIESPNRNEPDWQNIFFIQSAAPAAPDIAIYA